jgi:hypothetical protein
VKHLEGEKEKQQRDSRFKKLGPTVSLMSCNYTYAYASKITGVHITRKEPDHIKGIRERDFMIWLRCLRAGLA